MMNALGRLLSCFCADVKPSIAATAPSRPARDRGALTNGSSQPSYTARSRAKLCPWLADDRGD